MKSRFMQWFALLVNLDMQYFKVDKQKKKKMYENIIQMKKSENGREDKWITKKQYSFTKKQKHMEVF